VLKKFDTLFSSQVLLARIDAAEGKGEVAVGRLSQIREHITDEGQLAEVHYWLWKLVPALPSSPTLLQDGTANSSVIEKGMQAEQHRLQALRLYQALLARISKHEYVMRIEEIMASAPAFTPENRNATE
jgi:hypothetical protein